MGAVHLSTLTFSSRMSSELSDTGGSMATSDSTCMRWFCITSRTMPTPSK